MPIRNNFRVQKYIYYTILLLIVFIVIISIVYSAFFSVGSGFLKADEHTIDSPAFAYVEKVYVSPGDSVYKGEDVVRLKNVENSSYVYVKSDSSGMITDKFVNAGEIVTRGERMLALEKEDYYLLTFFKESDLKYLLKGFQVKIVFKDGGEFQGYIEKILPIVYPVNKPDKYYESDRRFVSVIVKIPNFHRGNLPYNAYAKVYVNKVEVFLWKRKNH